MRIKYDFAVQTKKYKTPRGYIHITKLVDAEPCEKIGVVRRIKERLTRLFKASQQ